MKITVNLDCSPDEARQFLGLPDVKPMQEAVMAKIQQQMLEGVANFSPEKLFGLWFSSLPQTADQFQKAMATFMQNSWGLPKDRA